MLMSPHSLTWVHKAPCRRDADGSSCSWQSRREQRTFCHSGSKCRAPTAGPPPGYPESGCTRSLSRRGACPATLAGSTWSGCSPGRQMREHVRIGNSGHSEKKKCACALQSVKLFTRVIIRHFWRQLGPLLVEKYAISSFRLASNLQSNSIRGRKVKCFHNCIEEEKMETVNTRPQNVWWAQEPTRIPSYLVLAG